MDEDEAKFIHDLNNKLAIVFGGIGRIKSRHEKLTKEEIVEIASKSKDQLDAVLALIEERVDSFE